MPSYGQSSRERLNTCHPLLQNLFEEVIKHVDCTILCGRRGRDDQEKAFSEGKSRAHYGQSPHNYSPSLAVDVMPYPIDWNDMDRLKAFAHDVKLIAAVMKIKVRWGGDFESFFDGPHWELVGISDTKIPE